VKIIDVLPWQVTARVASRLSVGRVFLVGDAAHTIPPIGAFGMNTGIADAHNLAWKIA
jgi:putative polyketide hydroxylase